MHSYYDSFVFGVNLIKSFHSHLIFYYKITVKHFFYEGVFGAYLWLLLQLESDSELTVQEAPVRRQSTGWAGPGDTSAFILQT